MENGREMEGYAELVIAMLLDPDAADTLTDLGRFHLTAGRSLQAVEVLERALAADAANALTVRAFADALIRADRTAEGKQRLDESERLQAHAIDIERRAGNAAVLALQAEIRLGEQDFDGAIDLWRQAIALQPSSAARQVRLAEALLAAKRHDEAAAGYLTAISLGAGVDVHRRLAEIYDTLGRTTEAARERAVYVGQRLEELRQRADEGAPAR